MQVDELEQVFQEMRGDVARPFGHIANRGKTAYGRDA